jgi:chorismate mutase
MDAPLNLADIRREIDALDAELRALLLKRADLVANVAASKAQSDDTGVLRPAREAAQMRALLDWQKEKAPHLATAGVLAIWREIIGLAIAQQGGLTVYASASAMPLARAYFGASLSYAPAETAEAALREAQDKNTVAVLALDEAIAPRDGQGVFARLPVGAAGEALCYGPVSLMQDTQETDVRHLVWRAQAETNDTRLAALGDGVLVETDSVGTDRLWGRYRDLGDDA